MAYLSSVKLLLKLDESYPYDLVTSNQFQIWSDSGATSATYNSAGYVMSQNQILYGVDWSLGISQKFSVGFWLYPVNSGLAKNTDTGTLESMKLMLMSFGAASVDSVTGSFQSTKDVVAIYEETVASGNRLVVTLNGPSDVTYTAKTVEYQVNQWHYVWIAWNGTSAQFKVFIDGEEQSLQSSGTLQTSLDASVATVWVNAVPTVLSADYNVMKNNAQISKIVILNDSVTSLATIQKMITNPTDEVFNSLNTDQEEAMFGFAFDDPTAIRITDIYYDGVYYYASCSDGKVLQGAPSLWQSRRDFSNIEESDVLDKFSKDTTGSNPVIGVEVTSNCLKIQNGTVRL